jgi:hypothetical protein
MNKLSAVLVLSLGLLACDDSTTGSGNDGGGAGSGTGSGDGGGGSGGPTAKAKWTMSGDLTTEGTIGDSQIAGGGVLLRLGGGGMTFNISLEGSAFGDTGTFDLSKKGNLTLIGKTPEGVLYNCGQVAGGKFPEVFIINATRLAQSSAAGTFSGKIHCSSPDTSIDVTGTFDF